LLASGLAAWDLLRTAPTDTLATAVAVVAPGAFQQRLWEELDQQDHAAALAVAAAADSSVLRGEITAEVEVLEARPDKPITRLRTTITRDDGT